MPCAPASSNFVLDPLLKLFRERLPFQKLDKEYHTLVCTLSYTLANSETVHDGMRVVRCFRRETHVYYLVQLS